MILNSGLIKRSQANGRILHLSTAATDLAVKDAGLDLGSLDKEKFGVYIGSGVRHRNHRRELHHAFEKGPGRVVLHGADDDSKICLLPTRRNKVWSKRPQYGSCNCLRFFDKQYWRSLLPYIAETQTLMISGEARAAITSIATAVYLP